MNNLKLPFILVFFFMCLLSFVSCDKHNNKDDVTELVMPQGHFVMNFSSFKLKNGDVLKITPTVDTSKSSPGLEIREAQYFWDGTYISTESISPFEFNYRIVNQGIGKHVVKIALRFGGKGYVPMKTQEPFEFEVNVTE